MATTPRPAARGAEQTHPDDPRADLRWGTTGALLADAARRLGDAEAIVDDGVRLTYAELDDAATAMARGFLAAGLRKGDRVAIWAPNSARWVVAALGLQRVGGVLVPLNTRFKGEEAAFVLGKSRARFLCTMTEFLGRDYPASLAEAAGGPGDGGPYAGLPDLEQVVTMSGGPRDGLVTWEDFHAAGAGVTASDVERRAAEVGPDDLSDMMFTSGTTGNPKGALCTHGQVLRAYAVWANVVGLREGDRYLIVNPFFHGFGYKAGWLASLMVGATILPARTLDVPRVLQTVRDERVTVLPGTPTLYQTMLEHPDFSAEGVASLRLSVTGATNVPPALLYRIKEELGFEHIVAGYGLTEACGIVSMCRYDDPLEVVTTTAGHPLPGLEVITVDSQGRPVPAGAEGEILVGGYVVMKGYFGEESETAAAVDSDGRLHTGDIGVIDADGRVRITGRIKEMFIVGGFNAYPAEIENILGRHPAVAQAAVIGVPDERMGEVGIAFVVPRRDARVGEAEIIAWSRDHMANYKVPSRVHIVDELPLNAAGKVLKNTLLDRLATRPDGN
ncbi:Acyl-CoA synthetase (AMP-forming)/AMP-acid ligase II [Thermomonospora echinospora]|uniref:Acyl-CoA synthetase (AMP-forming)/AMP-acid ligase II n=1 Tax=Thermomonospora echinospora TaxID=1992 RepID=A0A1H5T3H1_9ACTN|nr:FadD3 family acyl-CoA ligase [Thermomonospora echinospora]SEF57452.1 Acyl-CoA synthetase (AMP-forming)/AMP-acid ligase II [Thermomonospora echinospora]